MLNHTDIHSVKLLSGLFNDRALLNRNYLMELDSTCLLQNYYLEAGIVPGVQVINDPSTVKLHWGWESPTCQLRGHFLGHWLSAASMLVANNDDRELKAKIDFIIDELERCQKLNGGKWLAPFPEKYFTKLETGDYIWSPQYTIHKLILGLIHANVYAGNRKALTLLNGIGDWFLKWTDRICKSEAADAINKGEQGGMIEVWADLFELTNRPKFKLLAERYANPSIFDDLLQDKDPLTNAHQNASIPFIHGAARLYEITGERKYFEIVEKFWKCAVVEREAFCTGGQGSGEFWTPPHQAGQYLGDRTQEFCTVYNMVRVADYLFRFTGNSIYLDYIEKNIYNGFLAQQNKFTGMPTYFLPLKSGGIKKWGTKTKDFWCCHGTMVQAQTIYPNLCYYQNPSDRRIFVGQYIPSEATFTLDNDKIKITQTSAMKYYNDSAFFDDGDFSQDSRWLLKFKVEADCEFTLSFRVPNWIAGKPTVTVNGTKTDVPKNCDQSGFLNIKKVWGNDEVQVYFPTNIIEEKLSDMPEKIAVLEGPIVLAGISDNDYGLKAPQGIHSVLRPAKEHTYSTFPWQQSTYKTINQGRETTFVPLYEITDEAYTVYWTKI